MLFIFIGFLFVFFNFSVGSFDILPDFVGYILMLIGINKLRTISKNFKNAFPIVILLIVVSVLQIFGIFKGIIGQIVAIVLSLTAIYLIYLFDKGVKDLEEYKDKDLGSTKLLKVFKFQAIFTLACSVLQLIPLDLVKIINSFILLAALVSNIIFLLYFYQATRASAD